ncbi:MAG: glycerophosphodiester phosphodiesterase family protein [Solirubrobacterales bacterium]
MGKWRRRTLACAGLALCIGATPSVAAASPYIHAHRGGTLRDGKRIWPENTMPAFRSAARHGYVLELDVKLTQDGIPVVIHDATLDRTTPCAGLVADRTLADLGHCKVDVIGAPDDLRQLPRGDPRRAPIPTLRAVLGLLKRTGASANVEIKNIPTEPDYDPTSAYALEVTGAIRGSGVPSSQLIVQSFWPPNLQVSKQQLPSVETSLLTIGAANSAGPGLAESAGDEWVSPQWPVDQALVSHAHDLGLRVVPYTVDDAASMRKAFRIGVDALITDDPSLARSVFRRAEGPAPAIPAAPGKAACRRTAAARSRAPVRAFDPRPGAPRVFAMQFKQELRHVRTYSTFRRKVECMIRRYVVPFEARGRPNVVAFNEDVGLMTLATGSRGAASRALVGQPGGPPGCSGSPPPCAALFTLLGVGSAYQAQSDAYTARFGALPPFAAPFLATTDTFARGWMQVFSDMARRYHLYILGSNDQAPFRESRDPAEIDLFRDPDLPRPKSVYVATSPEVYNEAFMWGPRNVRREGPRPLRNVVASNRKVPLTPIEQALALTPGPAGGADGIANLRPYRLPGTRARISFATSLPAFEYGYEMGARPPALDPCSDIATYYMPCLDRLGANLVMQDEANSGPWAGTGGQGAWQPLEWMGSTWRAAADPEVSFDYNVTPHMVGNLADLPFDGQTAITQRGLRGPRRCTYVGNRRATPQDVAPFRRYTGRKRQFLALVPWVRPDGPRADLIAAAARRAAYSGNRAENDYLETAAIADLPFPPDPTRANCLGQ